MEEYLVSARKYRPASFDTVVGQRALTTTLLNAIRLGKLAHAYLFCGPRGVGKTTCARIFAKTINCMQPDANHEACNQCESCRAFDEARSMNIHELDAASNNSVEDMRELIKQVQIPPQIGRYKVFIIDEVHMLTTSAFNAFLKTLEEPPTYAIFILATTEKHKILPTILSRCQVYDFQRMSIKSTVDHLRYVAEKEGIQADDESLNLIAQKADGGMRDALSIFDQMVSFTGGNITAEKARGNLNVLDSEYYFKLVDHFLRHEVESCMLLLNEIINRGFDAGIFIGGLASHMRDLLVSRDASTLELLECSDSQRERFREQASRCEPKFIYRVLRLCNECDQAYRSSRNKRLQVEICLIECAQEEDVASLGRRPKKLNPLFKVLSAQLGGQQTVASVNASQATATTATLQTGQKDPPKSASARQPIQRDTTQHKLPTITLDAIPSINHPIRPTGNATQDSGQTVSAPQPSSAESASSPDAQASHPTTQTFNESNVSRCWHEYALRLPKEHTAMAQRMRAITPQVTGPNRFTITVNNAQVRKAMESYAPFIQTYIAHNLGQKDGVVMDIQVADIQVVQRTYSKPEILKNMSQHNRSFRKLVESLKLEID